MGGQEEVVHTLEYINLGSYISVAQKTSSMRNTEIFLFIIIVVVILVVVILPLYILKK